MTDIVNSREMVLTAFIRAKDVVKALGCSKSTAYAHLRRAAGRVDGDRTLLRVPLSLWEQYLRKAFPCDSSSGEEIGTAGSTKVAFASKGPRAVMTAKRPRSSPDSGSLMPRIPITRPREPV